MKDMSMIICLLLSVTGVVFAQLSIKKGLNGMGDVRVFSRTMKTYRDILLSPYVISGLCIYVLSMLLWLYALTRVDLSFAYPFLALSYVMILIASGIYLGERITPLRALGVLVICLGVLIVSNS